MMSEALQLARETDISNIGYNSEALEETSVGRARASLPHPYVVPLRPESEARSSRTASLNSARTDSSNSVCRV